MTTGTSASVTTTTPVATATDRTRRPNSEISRGSRGRATSPRPSPLHPDDLAHLARARSTTTYARCKELIRRRHPSHQILARELSMFRNRREHLGRSKAITPTPLRCRATRRRFGPTTAQTSPAAWACGRRMRLCLRLRWWQRARLAPCAQRVPDELPELRWRAEPVQAVAPARRLACAGSIAE